MYDHILAALDGSEPARCAGQFAISIAAATSARVTACHIYGAEGLRAVGNDMTSLTDAGAAERFTEPHGGRIAIVL